jgi:hypothetical protein
LAGDGRQGGSIDDICGGSVHIDIALLHRRMNLPSRLQD